MMSVDKVKGNGNDLGNEARSSGSSPVHRVPTELGCLRSGMLISCLEK